jgi:hypothetical protein
MRIFFFPAFFLAVMLPIGAQEQPIDAGAAVKSPIQVSAPVQKQFTDSQIEQLVAPIALYPDKLLAQVLAASTYPTDVVSAARWVKGNPYLSESDIKTELHNKKWDPSVQGLVFFPELLAKMNDNLDWTKDLGDAFMAQQKDVMDTVQVMRGKAKDAGTLKSDDNQNVDATKEGEIQIESADPETVYVDNYVPSESYGSWGSGISYDYPGVIVAPAWPWHRYGYGWALGYGCAWRNGYISHYGNNYFANSNRYNANNLGDANNRADLANKPWTHQQFTQRTAAPSTQQIAQQLSADRQSAENFNGAESRAAQNLRGNVPDAGTRPNAGKAPGNIRNTNRSPDGFQDRNNAFASAQSNAGLERAYSDRGYTSRANSSSSVNRSANASRGGAIRSGGGGSRGGGGRR